MTAGTEHISVKVTNQNTASDSADVDSQIGVQFNESVLHDAKIYNYSSDDPPDRKHRVARDLLDGGNPREAERILRGLLMNGRVTTERAYYYVLAILSDRSFIEINAALAEEIHRTRKLCAPLAPDEWTEAFDVVHALLRNAHTTFDGDAEVPDVRGYHALSGKRQTEIDRHLDLILSGAVQETLARQRKLSIAAERMANGRRERAWKFFEANPQRPRKYTVPPPRPTPRDWQSALVGTAVTVMGALWIMADGLSAVMLGLVLVAAGGWLAFRCTLERETHFLDAETTRNEFAAQPEDFEEPPTKLVKLVDHRFREAGQFGDWSAGYRAHLKRRLRSQYADLDMHHGEVTWLVDWHVKRFERMRREGTPCDSVPPPPGMRRALVLRALGVAVAASGLYLLLRDGHVQALLPIAAHWAILGLARLSARPRVESRAGERAEALLAEETAAHEDWVRVLEDRPTDAEMARWMALDKLYLKDEALRRADLNERDLVTHVVLTERFPFARRGRVTKGPPRYERYHVQIFLLTRYGMRSVWTRLDFRDGTTTNEKRVLFPYDAVASASIEEIGRPGNRLFELTLVSGVKIAEVKENVRDSAEAASDAIEDVDSLVNETSGFDSALRVLEAVATEGPDWIVRDEERKRRWAHNWSS